MNRLYCDDTQCPQFEGNGCKLGFVLVFRVPKSYTDIQYCDWGYLMPKVCRVKYRVSRRDKSLDKEV